MLIFFIIFVKISIVMNDTIVSISTPLGKGAVAIIRMSGKNSLSLASKIFSMPQKVIPRYMHFGKLTFCDGSKEECLMVYFKSPFSYTGEDVVEFQVHGGVLLAQKVLDACLNVGARMAQAGEYSKRAFLNGKISLDKAEAIVGEINAETEGELKSSLQLTNGKLAQKIRNEQDDLKMLLAEIEVGMDYPDESNDDDIKNTILKKIEEISKNNAQILKNAESAKYLKSGITVALVGKTNVGKSSIMNALLGMDRAIVTDIKGTTRDSVSESFFYNGFKINLVDTAGIRESSDMVENIGIEKSKQTIITSDVILFILDGSEKETEEDKEIEKLLKNKDCIYVINKSDKKRVLPKKKDEIEISAMSGMNIEKLKANIVKKVVTNEINFNNLILTNERQIEILKNGQKIINEIAMNLPLDILAMEIKSLWQTLGKITGNTENEDIIDLIFSKFCLGK